VKELDTTRQVYFLGIGGIGMSALARYFNAGGKQVAGYDRVVTALTRELEKEGIAIHYADSADLIPQAFKDPGRTLVVMTPAIPADHSELAYFRSLGYAIIKRSEVLGLITRNKKTIAVAGTHGKTTVSSMIAYLMFRAGPGCSAFLGGIARNFNSNLVLDRNSEWMVAEADEFDRSFLQLSPWAAVVTAMDPDHMDIYGNVGDMQAAYNQFISKVSTEGILLYKHGLPLKPSALPGRVHTYSLRDAGDFHAENVSLRNRQYHFDLTGPGTRMRDISLSHPGMVNVENAVAACSLAVLSGLDPERVRTAMAGFTGIRRRFEYHINSENLVFIDDYAHHPREIEATLLSLRELYPDKKLTGIFQPHLYTRTRDLADSFAESLDLLDDLILLDIYPARELPVQGVSSELIYNKVKHARKTMCSKEGLLGELKRRKPEVLITLGAGDIDGLVEPIKDQLLKRVGT